MYRTLFFELLLCRSGTRLGEINGDKKVVPVDARTGYLRSATDADTVRRGRHVPGAANIH